MRSLLLLSLVVAGVGCGPTAKEIESAQIHYDLGINAMEANHDPQGALRERLTAVQTNPGFADAHNALGLVYHLMLHKPEEAVGEYQLALKFDPKDSDAANNLGAALTDLGRYTEAAAMFERALTNDLYRTPYIARGNLGWALYKSGDIAGGITNLKASVQMNVDYCQGYRSLGMIASEQGQLQEALTKFSAFATRCPTMPEAHYRKGMVLLKMGDQEHAREEFGQCSSGTPGDLTVECERLIRMMQQ